MIGLAVDCGSGRQLVGFPARTRRFVCIVRIEAAGYGEDA
jgi:hypothetical protein